MGNSTGLSDGASAVLLASEEWAAARGLKPQAFLSYAKVAAVDFVHGEGLLMAPTVAVPQMLDKAGLTLQDFDFYEIHEAFAAQVLCTLRAWGNVDYCKNRLGRDKPLGSIDPGKLNVNGSSLALGHPFAATGTRIVATLAKLLEAQARFWPRLDFDRTGRRHGRHRDPRTAVTTATCRMKSRSRWAPRRVCVTPS